MFSLLYIILFYSGISSQILFEKYYEVPGVSREIIKI